MLEKLFTIGLTLYGLGWAFASLTLFAFIMYITKQYVDGRTPKYTDAEKAGIYIGIAIPSFFLSFFFSRYLIYFIIFALEFSNFGE